VIDKDLTHLPGRHCEEMRPAVQRQAVDIHQSQVHLMDQGSRLQRVRGSLALEMAPRHPAQLVVHHRDQAFERRGVSLALGDEQARYIVRGALGHQRVRENVAGLRFISYRADSGSC
jgi:hypothetical protein